MVMVVSSGGNRVDYPASRGPGHGIPRHTRTGRLASKYTPPQHIPPPQVQAGYRRLPNSPWVFSGQATEVDICAEGEIACHEVLLGIECRAWKRPQTIEWVEAMFGKRFHLPTSKLVLVSSSGFTANALKLAEFLGTAGPP
jgi:hypothetical protein